MGKLNVLEHGNQYFTAICPECGCKLGTDAQSSKLPLFIAMLKMPDFLSNFLIRYKILDRFWAFRCPDCGKSLAPASFKDENGFNLPWLLDDVKDN